MMGIIIRSAVKRKLGYLYYVDGKGNVCEAWMGKNKFKKNEKLDKYGKEQKDILDLIEKETKNLYKIKKGVLNKKSKNKNKYGWNKYKGRIASQIIIKCISKYLPKHLKIVGHDYFIYKYPTEWDALIIKKKAKPYYNTYDLKDIRAVIEIKAGGIWGGIGSVTSSLKQKKNIKRRKIEYIFLVVKTSKAKEIIKSFKIHSYILNESYFRSKPKIGEWKRLIKYIKTL